MKDVGCKSSLCLVMIHEYCLLVRTHCRVYRLCGRTAGNVGLENTMFDDMLL